jgi:hypothetical protein
MAAKFELIEKNSLRALPDGYEFLIHLNWYRSLPLSSVVKVQLKLDNEPVDPEQISFGINNYVYTLKELGNHYEEFWFVQDGARLIVNQPRKIALGETHTIWAEVSLRYPYIPIGPNQFLTTATQYSSTQVAA